jgi:hypothetical protein
MAFLSERDQNEVTKLFEQLDADVKILYFTQRESPLYLPGQECETCRDTRLLLEEVAGLSDKINLEVHDFVADSEIAREHGIDRIRPRERAAYPKARWKSSRAWIRICTFRSL